ncbi:sugar-binding transcriptional regulator [Glaesserella sp.]|uniref:sugar-binding transcriptional regulator n=1 Tax=Glaesserella sp. TaxID=2094731 RepID=UPI00359FCE4A
MTVQNKHLAALKDNPKYIYSFVTKQYFIEMKNKSEIADELGISRFKVARLITEAIEKEYVRFIFPKLQDLDDEIAHNLKTRYGLKDAVVLSMLDSYEDQALLTDKLGMVTSDYLCKILQKEMKVGIAWGKVLSSVIAKLHDLPPVDVIQLSGVHPKIQFNQGPIDLVHKMASLTQGKAYPIYLPMWVENEETVAQLVNDPYVAEARKFYSQLDVVITGIGDWKSHSTSLQKIFPTTWVTELERQDIRADICTTFVDSNGHIIPSPLEKLGFSISAENLQKTPNVIGVAGGQEKYDGILASLKSGLLDTLITDFYTAIKLLDEKNG